MVFTKKQKIAALSVISNTTLIILKTVVGILSGSVSIISEAIHSSMDLVAAIIAYISVSISEKPADERHPYGHGKIENISGVIEGLLIFLAAGLIIMAAVKKLFHPMPIEETLIGAAVMLFSAAVNTIVAHFLYKTAREEDSVALEADALHLKTDVYTSLGIAAGLLAIKVTGLYILDPLIAICVAMLIIKEAWYLCSVAFSPLLDARLNSEEEQPLKDVLEHLTKEKNFEIKYLKTRKSGSLKFADFHLLLTPETTIREGNIIAQTIRDELQRISPSFHVHINLEMRGSVIPSSNENIQNTEDV
mgnify:CR=1 FL=1